MRRWIHLSLMLLAVLAIVELPDASAQRRRGNRGGGGNSLFGPRGGRRGARSAPKAVDTPRPQAAPKPAAPLKGGQLADEELRYLKLLREIDRTLAENQRKRSEVELKNDALGFELERTEETGEIDWVALQRPIFETADYDGSGWLSYREARDSIAVERDEFALYDHDRDGRIGSREFSARYADVVARTGAFRVPKPKNEAMRGLPRTPEQLRNAFDRDSDGALQTDEIAAVLAEYERRELQAEVLLETLDQDRSGAIEGPELYQMSRVLSAAFLLAQGDQIGGPKVRSIEDLFGRATPRAGLAASDAAPWIPGPVPHFRRLDWDGNGFITGDELHALQGGATLGTRLGAVFATLDVDEDGQISEREFLTALSTARK